MRFRLSVVIASLALSPVTLLGQAAAPAGPPPAAAVPAAPQTTLPETPQTAGRWPLQVDTPDGQVTVFQPQLDNFEGDTLTARVAVSVLKQGQTDPIFGAAWIKSRVATDRVARTVSIQDVTVMQTRFPNSDATASQSLANSIGQALTTRPITLSLDQLLAMVGTVQKEQAAAADLQTAPPKIVFRDHPAVLVQYDGTPRLAASANGGPLRAMNTPFFIALDGPSKTYFLKGANRWFAAPDPLGPFQAATQVPVNISSLADSTGYKDADQSTADQGAPSLEIVTATEPTELLWTDGPEQMSTIAGTTLLYVANTEADLFVTIDSQQRYVLLSGRWYTAPNRNGPWTYVPGDQLPADFSRIPPGSAKANVLASVPNTPAARDAIADSYVPQTAAVDRAKFDQPTVTYDGDPQFAPVENIGVSYATNTPDAVLLCDGQYYCCSNAVWYVGSAAVGPWGLCTHVPPAIYTLPPSCPLYPVRYCYVYGYTPDVVYCGYLPGYVGCYPFGGAVVFGTGWRYSPWVSDRFYYARPATFGYAARYDVYTSHWGFDFAIAGGGGRGWVANHVGPFVRGGEWFGPGGYRPAYERPNPAIGFIAARPRVDAGPGRGDIYVRNVYDRRADVRGELGPHGDVVAGPGRTELYPRNPGAAARDDVFADRNGNVYRRSGDNWEVRGQSGWQAAPAGGNERRLEEEHQSGGDHHVNAPTPTPVPHPVAVPDHPAAPARGDEPHGPVVVHGETTALQGNVGAGDLNRDYRARVEGEERERSYRGGSDEAGAATPPSEPRESATPRGGGGESHAAGGGGSGERGGGGSGPGGGGAGGNGHK